MCRRAAHQTFFKKKKIKNVNKYKEDFQNYAASSKLDLRTN